MLLRLAIVYLLGIVLMGCQTEPTRVQKNNTASVAATTADNKFAALAQRWLDGWLKLNPVAATQVGDHRFDGELDDLSAGGRQHIVDFSKKILAELDAIEVANLSRQNQVDAAILRNQLRYDVWTDEV